MRWSRGAGRTAAGALLALLLMLPARSTEERRVTVYSPGSTYAVPILERNGIDYLGLVEVLEPVCGVSAWRSGNAWQLRCDKNEAEFTLGGAQARIRGKKISLDGHFLVENGHGMVPLRAIPQLLSQLLGQKVELHDAARRMFLGNAAIRFTPELTAESLLVNFSAPVNPSFSTEPGKLKMTFQREAVTSGMTTVRFDSPLVSAITFSESNGKAELTVTGKVPLLATFSDQGKTIVLSPAPGQAAAIPPATPAQATPAPVAPAASSAPATQGPAAASPPPAAPAPPPAPAYLVVIDASHGGSERGAALSDKLAEKDVTLAIARRLKNELSARGFATLMTRDGDATVALDQRAIVANSAHAVLFVSIHAATLGRGVRVYTAMVPVEARPVLPFRSWDAAQADFLSASGAMAQRISAEIAKREIPAGALPGPVRPLNNVAAPAVAVEVAPNSDKPDSLTSTAYQQSVAGGIATAIAAARPQLGQGQ